MAQRNPAYLDDASDRMVPGEGDLPLVAIVAALPHDVVIGLEIPMRARAEAGESTGEQVRRCVEGARRLLAARRVPVLEESAERIRVEHGVEVRTVSLDLTTPDALASLAATTFDLDVGLFVYNAGGDTDSALFLDRPLDNHLALLQPNCTSVLEAAHRFGQPMVERGRGALVLVTSGAAWAGGAMLATYGATKAFDLILAEALDHLSDGPTWLSGSDNPTGGSPFGPMNRRDAVLAMRRGSASLAKKTTADPATA